jgi:hypothetical protein
MNDGHAELLIVLLAEWRMCVAHDDMFNNLSPAAVTVTVTAPTPACDETAVMAGKNALSNDEDKSSTIPKQSVVIC